MTIGERIKQYRKQRKITQKQLSETIGKSYSIVQKYENNLVIPPWDALQKIAAVFNLTTAELVDGVDMFANTGAASEFDLIDQLRADTLEKYDRLNDLGREKANEYITDLAEIDRYKRT